jgi:rhamnose transport system permease protein
MTEQLLTQSPPEVAYPSHFKPLWRRTLLTHEGIVILLLGVVIVLASLLVPRFATPITLTFLLIDITPILLIALPMTLVIIVAEIDLSVASIFGLGSVSLGILFQAGVPIELAMIAAVAICAAAGAFNGFLISTVGLGSLPVTVGTLALYRGLAVGLLGTTAITSFPVEWTKLAQANVGQSGVPLVVLPTMVMIAIFVVVLHFTPFGRSLFAIGASAEAAHFSGVNVRRTKVILFIVSGAVAGLAGVFYTLRFGNAIGSNGLGIELAIIAAVVLGGVSIFGGRGTIVGAVAGVLLIGVLASALRLGKVPASTIDVITGVVLVLSAFTAIASRGFASRRGSPGRGEGAASAAKSGESGK